MSQYPFILVTLPMFQTFLLQASCCALSLCLFLCYTFPFNGWFLFQLLLLLTEVYYPLHSCKKGDKQKKFTCKWQLPPTHRSTHSRWLKGDNDSMYDWKIEQFRQVWKELIFSNNSSKMTSCWLVYIWFNYFQNWLFLERKEVWSKRGDCF